MIVGLHRKIFCTIIISMKNIFNNEIALILHLHYKNLIFPYKQFKTHFYFALERFFIPCLHAYTRQFWIAL